MDKEPHKYADLVASDIPVEGPIEEDIPRTMYDHELFCRKSRVNGRDMLRRVLTAYGRYDREVRCNTFYNFSFVVVETRLSSPGGLHLTGSKTKGFPTRRLTRG